MEKANTYVYFALQGENFDPQIGNDSIGVFPTESWKKGDKGLHTPMIDFSCWKLCTDKGREYIMVDILVDEIVDKLWHKI